MRPLQTNNDGNVILNPVSGWTVAPVAEIAALLVVEYLETPEQLQTMDSKSIQFVLTPVQAMELADKLHDLGRRLLQTPQGTSLQ